MLEVFELGFIQGAAEFGFAADGVAVVLPADGLQQLDDVPKWNVVDYGSHIIVKRSGEDSPCFAAVIFGQLAVAVLFNLQHILPVGGIEGMLDLAFPCVKVLSGELRQGFWLGPLCGGRRRRSIRRRRRRRGRRRRRSSGHS